MVRDLAERRGLQVLRAVEEPGHRTGTRLAGRQLQAVLAELQSGQLRVDYFVVRDFERLFRPKKRDLQSQLDAVLVRSVLMQAGVRVLDHGGEHDPANTFAFGIKMLSSEDDTERTLAKFRSGRQRALADGKYAWATPPFGYRRVYSDKRDYQVVPDPEEVRVLRTVLSEFATRGSVDTALWLREHQVRTPDAIRGKVAKANRRADWDEHRWSHQQVLQLCDCADRYASGRWTYSYLGETHELQLEPVLDAALAERVRAERRHRTARADLQQHETTGLLRCKCGGRVENNSVTCGGRKYCYVRCRSCSSTIRQEPVADLLWRSVLVRSLQLMAVRPDLRQDHETARRVAERVCAGVRQQMRELVRLRVQCQMDEQVFRAEHERLATALAAAEADLARAQALEQAQEQHAAEHATLQDRLVAELERLRQQGVTPTGRRRVMRQILGEARAVLDYQGPCIELPEQDGAAAWSCGLQDRPWVRAGMQDTDLVGFQKTAGEWLMFLAMEGAVPAELAWPRPDTTSGSPRAPAREAARHSHAGQKTKRRSASPADAQ